MNRSLHRHFKELLRRQLSGDDVVVDALNGLNVRVEDGYCLYNLYQEWKGAFSFQPGAIPVALLICSLAEKLESYEQDDTLRLFAEPEWACLVGHRGPFESAAECTCAQCGSKYIGFVMSGFDDRQYFVCHSCGEVWLQSQYDDVLPPVCECGMPFCPPGCPHCGSTEAKAKVFFSSYAYFMKHQWKEKPHNID